MRNAKSLSVDGHRVKLPKGFKIDTWSAKLAWAGFLKHWDPLQVRGFVVLFWFSAESVGRRSGCG